MLHQAAEGSPSEITNFYEELLRATLFVPERYQAHPLSDAPRYPNEFVNILGVQDKSRVVVPCFCAPEQVQDWCGQPLSTKALSLDQVLALIPEGWWLVLNPGAEVCKEFTPWELQLLRGGVVELPALVAEFRDGDRQPLSLTPVDLSEHQALVTAARLHGESTPEIRSLFLCRDVAVEGNEKIVQLMIAGVTRGIALEAQQEIRERLHRALTPLSVGTCPLKTIICDDEDALLAPFLRHMEPIFSRAAEEPERENFLGRLRTRLELLASKIFVRFASHKKGSTGGRAT